MVSAIQDAPRCRHTPRAPFRGMRQFGIYDDDHLTFGCEVCGAYFRALRCEAITKTGTRCHNAAQGGLTLCVRHRLIPAVST